MVVVAAIFKCPEERAGAGPLAVSLTRLSDEWAASVDTKAVFCPTGADIGRSRNVTR